MIPAVGLAVSAALIITLLVSVFVLAGNGRAEAAAKARIDDENRDRAAGYSCGVRPGRPNRGGRG